MSALALLVSCITLFVLLRPEPEPEAVEEPEPPVASEPIQVEEIPTIEYREHVVPVLADVPVNGYDDSRFKVNERGWLTYETEQGAAAIGIDVSSYQGDINWEKVADSGVGFAMIRAGYRGYSKGVVMEDKNFKKNIQGALDAGVEVGVYFFSQATNVWEAQEEADYLLEAIEGYDVTYPVVYDWEFIAGNSEARTSGMKSDDVTHCAGAFCDMVKEAGYEPMIYFNQDLGYLTYGLDQLTDYGFWLAEYNAKPNFYYDFDLWQYTHRGTVPGIEGSVDLNLDLRALKADT